MVSIQFHHPMLGVDLNDSREFISDKHWILGEYCDFTKDSVNFFDDQGVLIVSWSRSDIRQIYFPVLGPGSVTRDNYRTETFTEDVKRIRPNAWIRWTEEEDAQLKRDFSMGLNLEQIAVIHQRTAKAIWERLCKWELVGDIPRPEGGGKEVLTKALADDPSFFDVQKEGARICLGCGLPCSSLPCFCWTQSNTTIGFKSGS